MYIQNLQKSDWQSLVGYQYKADGSLYWARFGYIGLSPPGEMDVGVWLRADSLRNVPGLSETTTPNVARLSEDLNKQ